MTTQARLMTAEELWQLPDDGQRHELVEGALITMAPPAYEHGKIALRLGSPLMQYVEANKLGEAVVESGFLIRRNPDTVRSPDVAFTTQERLAAVGRVKGFLPIAPDLVAEIVSANDLYTEVTEKVAEWLAAGTRMVLVIDPRHHTVTVHRSPTAVTALTEADQIDGADVVPGWTMPVRALFE